MSRLQQLVQLSLLTVLLAGASLPDASFEVHVQVDQESLQSSAYRENGVFFVNTRITNNTEHNETVVIWTQYGESWTSDTSQVTVSAEALKNAPTPLVIKPGQSLSKRLEIHVARDLISQKMVFRLGFDPNVTPEDLRSKHESGPIFWSNPVMLARE